MYSEDQTILAEQGALFTHQELVDMIRTLHEACNEAKWSPEPRITAEMALLSICRRVAAADWDAVIARISAIENKMASGTTMPAHEAGQKKVPDKQNHPSVSIPIAGHQSPVQKPVGQKAKTAEPSVEPTGTALPRPGKENAGKIWDTVLKELLADGKRSVHACVSQGEILQLDDHQAIIGFGAKFSKERSEREDFRSIIEKVMAHVCGRPIRLQCILGKSETFLPAEEHTVKTDREETTVSKSETILQKTAESEEHPAIREALQMFGGKITKE